jgi:membrane protein insertase Oxa1/YidC/SpoIIIJ
MGRTVPSFRIAAEWEKSKWRSFRQELDKRERKTFDEMMSLPRLYNVAGIGACKPVLIQTILISIIFEHYKQLTKLEVDGISKCY